MNITQIPSGLFDNNTKVTDFSEAFNHDRKLTAIPTGLFDHCTEVENFAGTFGDCISITSIPSGLFDKCTKVTDFGHTRYDGNIVGVFADCTNLTGNAPELWKRTNVTSYQKAFAECKKLNNYADIPDDWK